MQTNVLEYLENTVRRVPYKLGFSDGIHAMTFREIYDQARAIGSWLYRNGIYGQSVAVLMEKQPRTITAFLGVIYGGNYYVPLDTQIPRCRAEGILKSSRAQILLCDEGTEAIAREMAFSGKVICYENAAFGIIDEEALAQVRQEQLDIDPIYIVFTSGSTGVPKGVTGCHRAVIDYIENLCDVLKFSENTVFGNQTPLYFDACLKEILPALKYGAAVELIPKELFSFPVRLVEYMNRKKINTLCWVVSALTMISSFRTFDVVTPEYVHTVAFASEVFPIRQLKLWRSALPHARFFNLYGPTETTGICCYYEVDREFDDNEILPVGKPFRNTQILLLDENGFPTEKGETGEICIRGTRLTLGYFDDPDRTDAAFVQNPMHSLYPDRIYRTGDMGRYNDRGELVFLSRKDHQIKHMGHRIELGEIETAAGTCPQIRNACCVYDDERQKIILYYTGIVQVTELADYLKERLPRYMLPNMIRQLNTIPLTPNGKLDRNSLKQS